MCHPFNFFLQQMVYTSISVTLHIHLMAIKAAAVNRAGQDHLVLPAMGRLDRRDHQVGGCWEGGWVGMHMCVCEWVGVGRVGEWACMCVCVSGGWVWVCLYIRVCCVCIHVYVLYVYMYLVDKWTIEVRNT